MRALVIDGVEIPEALLAQEAQNHPGGSAAEARAAAGHALAIRALLLHRALELGLETTGQFDERGREETLEEALIRELLDAEVEVASPSDAECRRVYDAAPGRFRTPALTEASHILIEPRLSERGGEDHAAIHAAHDVAAAMILTLAAGADGFAALARQHSDCPSGVTGGSLGQLSPGDLVPEIERVLAGLAPGEVAAQPVRSRFGWHVLRLDRRIEGRQLPFEMVVEVIRLHLESRAWTSAAARYVAELTAQARGQGVALTLTDDGGVRQGSATLGDFLGDTGAAERLVPWLDAVDADLGRRLAAAALAADETPPDFARAAMAEFVADANDERWTQLISAARDSEDPALACLAAVLRSKLVPARKVFTVIRRVAS
ncbi:peptidyl-prolyl cis-trans isomerase C [Caulobacter ginsengisoli]|uniref:Parvulin-like PPIase n=1 Tax=Caulobacter ginsengisoli TaxID=400775 RepID=A0ABU0ISP3_9CAUL|nr:peptidylprolyl isomerase [Caulobacter ginsengisoli]MDQ0464430.1 peptidyl-prolyl cis-trans isomerase C [Caulobacter ginsengisoli]